MSDRFDSIIKSVYNDLTVKNPVEILKYYQSHIIRGRKLEITTMDEFLEGDVNYMDVDRDNIIETSFDELNHFDDLSKTFQVSFYGEQAFDSGGPRKEWLRLLNREIYHKYFQYGLKEHLVEEYRHVGEVLGITLLQNGDIPKYFTEDHLQVIVFDISNLLKLLNLKKNLYLKKSYVYDFLQYTNSHNLWSWLPLINIYIEQ